MIMKFHKTFLLPLPLNLPLLLLETMNLCDSGHILCTEPSALNIVCFCYIMNVNTSLYTSTEIIVVLASYVNFGGHSFHLLICASQFPTHTSRARNYGYACACATEKDTMACSRGAGSVAAVYTTFSTGVG